MKSTALKAICDEIKRIYPTSSKNYGEAHRVIVEGNAANYFSIDGNQPCSCDDNYDIVIFFVRQNSTPTSDEGRGLKQKLTRDVNFQLVCNAKKCNADFNLNFILNNIPEVELGETDNSTKSIAQDMFGLEDHNFETYFFSISFSIRETIDCIEC